MKDKYQFGDYDPFDAPDTKTLWQIVGPPIKIVLCIIGGLVLLAHWPYVQDWMELMDKSDQYLTGVVLLVIGSVSFAVLFFMAKYKR